MRWWPHIPRPRTMRNTRRLRPSKMRVQVDAAGFARDLRLAATQALSRVVVAIDEEVKAGGDGLKADLRSETEGLLGSRVANAWRGKFFANKGRSGGPAAF